jgi:hypothetical protein
MRTSSFEAFLAVFALPNNPSIVGMATPTLIGGAARLKGAK